MEVCPTDFLPKEKKDRRGGKCVWGGEKTKGGGGRGIRGKRKRGGGKGDGGSKKKG